MAEITYNPTTQISFVEPDPFLGQANRQSSYIPGQRGLADETFIDSPTDKSPVGSIRQPDWTVARPTSGIVIKPNTFAVAKVVNSKGEILRVLNSSLATGGGDDGRADAWTDWLLAGVQEDRAEKTQIVETFGETFLYAYGQRSRVLSFSGILLNTVDYNWRAIFWENWDTYFRATRLIQNDARMYISFDDILVEGYPLNATAQQSAGDSNQLNFQFTFFVTNYVNVSIKSGAALSKAYSLGQVSAGYGLTYARQANGVYKVVGAELTDTRMELVKYLGKDGVAAAAGKVAQAAADAGVPAGLAAIAGTSVFDLLNRASKGIYDPAGYGLSKVPGTYAPSYTDALLNNVFGANVEKTYGLKPGEFDKFLGFTTSFASTIVANIGVAPTIAGLSIAITAAVNNKPGGMVGLNYAPREKC